ncbi:MAG: nitroreductase family protein, partial [Actinobacteria bacterium]|nr:nitroreductase family protein [Actinomycetota bacterium]
MNDVFEIIKKRRSIRHFKNIHVEDEKILQIIDAARLAPSSANRQPWRFIIVKDRNLLVKISSKTLGTINKWAKTAPLIIVCCSVRKNILTNYIGEHLSGVKYHIIDTA